MTPRQATTRRRRVFPIPLLLALSAIASGQQAESPTESEAEEPALEEAASPSSPLLDAALNSIRANDPQTPSELLRAVHVLQRLGAVQEAKSYLARVLSAVPTTDQLVEIHRELGTARLVQIANDKQLGPTADALVRAIFAAVREAKRDPERLRELISQLAAEDAEARRAAMIGLREAGAHAIPPLLQAYRELPEGVTAAWLDAAVTQIGTQAEDALIAALSGPDATLQQVAARLLGRVGTRQARIHLIRPYFSPHAGVRRAAADALQQLGFRPPPASHAAVAYLSQRARRHLVMEPVTASEDGVEMWTWSVEADNVVAHRLSHEETAAVNAARLARDAYELSPDAENTILLLASRLQVDQRLGGLDQRLQRGAGSAYELSMKAGVETVSNALAFSLKHQLDAAAQGATEVLGDMQDMAALHQVTQWSPLVRALQSPNRRVRYGAARAIMSIDPRTPYPGASLLMETLVDLSQVAGRVRALLVTPRRQVADRLAGILAGMGIDVARIPLTGAAIREAMATSDYDVLLLSDSVYRPTASELIQQLRKDPQSGYLPVVLLVREGNMDRAERIAAPDDRVLVMPEFADADVLARSLATAEQSVRGVAVPAGRRLEQAEDALGWLTHLAEYSRTYSWYDIMRAREAGVYAVSVPELAGSAIDLLGYLGDQASQQLLLENAAQRGLSADRRQQAANAFAESVLRRGLMLTNAELSHQYDRLRASDSTDAATREILAQVVDVIETQTKPRPPASR